MGLWVSREYFRRSPNIFFICIQCLSLRKIRKNQVWKIIVDVFFFIRNPFFSKIVKNAVLSARRRGKQQPKKSILDFIYFFRLPNSFALTNENKKMCIIYIWRTHNFLYENLPKKCIFHILGWERQRKNAILGHNIPLSYSPIPH